MVHKLGMIVLIIFLFSCYSHHPRSIYTADHTPRETAGYQIQSGATTIGYAHKYQWETNDGSLQHHYFIYNSAGTMVGYVGEHGETKKYLANGKTKQLGSYTLEDAAAKIFNGYADIRIFTARKMDVPIVHSLSITDKHAPSKHPCRTMFPKKRIVPLIQEKETGSEEGVLPIQKKKVGNEEGASASGDEKDKPAFDDEKQDSLDKNSVQDSSEKQEDQEDDTDDEWPE